MYDMNSFLKLQIEREICFEISPNLKILVAWSHLDTMVDIKQSSQTV